MRQAIAWFEADLNIAGAINVSLPHNSLRLNSHLVLSQNGLVAQLVRAHA